MYDGIGYDFDEFRQLDDNWLQYPLRTLLWIVSNSWNRNEMDELHPPERLSHGATTYPPGQGNLQEI